MSNIYVFTALLWGDRDTELRALLRNTNTTLAYTARHVSLIPAGAHA
jgi:DUF1365 family protein